MYALEKENGNIVTLLKLAKASDEAGRSESVDSQMFMDETMASIYKDFSGGDRDSLKNQSTSSNNSTPSVASSGEEGSKVYVSVATISNSNPVFSVEQKN